jgi:hypothetical protein
MQGNIFSWAAKDGSYSQVSKYKTRDSQSGVVGLLLLNAGNVVAAFHSGLVRIFNSAAEMQVQ